MTADEDKEEEPNILQLTVVVRVEIENINTNSDYWREYKDRVMWILQNETNADGIQSQPSLTDAEL